MAGAGAHYSAKVSSLRYASDSFDINRAEGACQNRKTHDSPQRCSWAWRGAYSAQGHEGDEDTLLVSAESKPVRSC